MAYANLLYTTPFQYAKLKYPEVGLLLANVIPRLILTIFFVEKRQIDSGTLFQVSGLLLMAW